MKLGYLSQYFEGVAVKTLSAVEADVLMSNQHEYNGVAELKKLFGPVNGVEKRIFPAKFVYLSDSESMTVIVEDGKFLTWYDARARSATRTGRSEYRLYFPTTSVSRCSVEGDLLLIGRLASGLVLVLIAQGKSSIANQLKWLFGFSNITQNSFEVRDELNHEQDRIGFAARVVLEQIGIEVVERVAEEFLSHMFEKFGKNFPKISTFSQFARDSLEGIEPTDDPDKTLMAWMEREELLFRAFEREIVRERLAKGFAENVDEFMKFSLSVQNRRKSRAGGALENHLASIFDAHNINYSRTSTTENNSKPDFLFPGGGEYESVTYPSEKLTVLGAKTTCKDRWRQVLSEADKIKTKHLLTLEAAISEPQTNEMRAKSLQLVVPRELHSTYSVNQQSELMCLREFIMLVQARQASRFSGLI